MVYYEAPAESQHQAGHQARNESVGPVPHQEDWAKDDHFRDRYQEA